MEGEINQDAKQSAEVSPNVTTSSSSATSTETQQQTVTESTQASETTQSQPEKRKRQYVPLDDLIKERQRRRELEEQLEAERASKKSTEPLDRVKKIQAELGVEEEVAKSLDKVLNEYTAPLTAKSSEQERLQKKINQFAEKAADAALAHEDWDDLKADMEKIFQEKYEKDPHYALTLHPEDYYFQAKGRRGQSPEQARQQGAKEALDKVNSKNLAVTETGRNSSSTKPEPPKKWTRERLKSLSHAEYLKYESEIKAAIARGDFAY